MVLRKRTSRRRAMLLLAACVVLPSTLGARTQNAARGRSAEPGARPQARAHGSRVSVGEARIEVDDGDTVVIHWTKADAETVRLLGIDAPETPHPEHEIPYGQPFGPEARAVARGVFAAATRVELLRAATLDPYGRTLGYLFVNGRNYSVLVVRARLAAENVSHFGDNGLPAESAEVVAAAREAGPLRFEPPHLFRARMRELSKWLGARGLGAEQ